MKFGTCTARITKWGIKWTFDEAKPCRQNEMLPIKKLAGSLVYLWKMYNITRSMKLSRM